jgi:hypothetical protein
MGVDEIVMRQVPSRVPTISAERSSFELIVKPEARADSTLMRSRIRLLSVVNWIMTPRCEEPSRSDTVSVLR